MNEQTIKSNKIQLSLAAVLFFSFFVRKLLQENTMELDDQAEKFVQSYILYWYGILLISLCTIIWTITYYFIPSSIIYRLHTTGAIVIIIAIIVGIAGIFNDSQLINRNHIQQVQTKTTDTKNILTAYIPLYNIYLWYKLHSFDKPYRRAKESIIMWLSFVVITIAIQSPILSVVIIIAIIARITTLLWGIDIFHDDIQKKANTWFYKNPEEIRWYVTGIITSIIHYFTSHIRETQETIKQHKVVYQKLTSIHDPQIRIELSISIILLIRRTITRDQTIDVRIYYLTSILVIWRYVVLGRKRKHLPYIPWIHEIIEWVKLLLNKYIPWRENRLKNLSPQK